ncbi:MAG: PepSY domain-containing protein [Planctomycetaceae bacterium]
MNEPTPSPTALHSTVSATGSAGTSGFVESPALVRGRRWSTSIGILIRRIHLYSGLFLVPWVVLYGITGAMFNHVGLFPRVQIREVDGDVVAKTQLSTFPSAQELADRVIETLQKDLPDHRIELTDQSRAEFTGDLMFAIKSDEGQHVVHMDPVSRDSWIGLQPPNEEEPEALLPGKKTIRLPDDPHNTARAAAAEIFRQSGLQADNVQPLGWTKLNFLASVDGEPARVTYVLKDGHVDVDRFTGEDGMPLRQFLLRMHTSHGQPPYWNGRMFWSLIVDTMAIAMVTWAVSGIYMWWQIKRTRLIGAGIIVLSLLVAAGLWFSLQNFYATTRL